MRNEKEELAKQIAAKLKKEKKLVVTREELRALLPGQAKQEFEQGRRFADYLQEYLLNEDILIQEDMDEFEIIDDAENDSGNGVESVFTAFTKNIKDYRILSKEEVNELVLKAHDGDISAQQKLMEHNEKLVTKIAVQYAKAMPSMDVMDLIQDGNLGLVKAIKKFDVNRGLSFSTYASIWIKQTIRREIADNSRTIRLPVYLYSKVPEYRKAVARFYKENGFMPTARQLSEIIDLSEDAVRQLEKTLVVTSLGTPISEDGEDELMCMIPDTAPGPEEQYMDKARAEAIKDVLSGLKDLEKDVIIRRYGLFGRSPETLNEIGISYGVSRERIRQIEERAFRALRRKSNVDKLAAFVSPEAVKILEEYKNSNPKKHRKRID